MNLDEAVARVRELRWACREAEAHAALAAVLPEAVAAGGTPLVDAWIEQGVLDPRSDALERALRLAEALGDRDRTRRVRLHLAEQRMLTIGVAAAREALAEVEDLEDDLYGCILCAEAALFEGDLDGLERFARRTLSLAQAEPGPLGTEYAARACNQLGMAALARGDVAAARVAFRDAIARLERTGRIGDSLAIAWNGLGDCARADSDLDAAVEHYRAATRTFRHDLYPVNLAIVELERGRTDEAADAIATVRADPTIPMVGLAANLVRAVCAADRGDAGAYDAACRPFARGWPYPAFDRDVARLAGSAARRAGARPGWEARAVRLHRVALITWRGLGRTREAELEERALRRLADRGAAPVVGPFELLRPLARGAFGEVWRARHLSGAEVAVKVFVDRAERSSLARELAAVAALDHPNVIRLLDHGRVDRVAAVMAPPLSEGQPWLATELADGTLEPRLGRTSWAEVRALLVALLDALAHAHARGLLHLDVKPANVLLVAGQPRLADFGLARAPGVVEERGAGTPPYMAPEQFANGGWGPWTDLYAVGCLATALVSGTPPFSAPTLEAMRRAHLETLPHLDPVVAVPDGFLPWLRRLLAKRPEDRFRRAADAARALLSIGDAADHRPGGIPADASDLPTVVLPASPVVEIPRLDEGERLEIPAPVVPDRWERAQRPPPPLTDAGLALFGMRTWPFVGRTPERDALWAALREVAATGRPRVVAVRGATGIGTSALASWLCERAHEVGAAEIATVRASAADPPGAALTRAIAKVLSPTGAPLAVPGTSAIERRLIAEVIAGAPGFGPSERNHLLARALELAALQRPIVLHVDGGADDRAVSGTLERLRDRRAPVLVVRTGAASPDPPDTLGIDLGPLSTAETHALLDGLLPLHPATRDALVAAIDGHPRFAVQVATDLVVRERLRAGPDGATLAPGVLLPRSTAELAADRVRAVTLALPPEARRSLQLAALLEGAVDDRLWSAACGHAGLAFATAGREALVAARLAVEGPGGFAIEDREVRESLARGTPGSWHAACAASLAEVGGDRARAAWHWEHAGRDAEAAAALEEAITQRIENGAHAEVDALSARLEALADRLRPDAARRARIALGRLAGTSALHRGRADEALASFARARDLARAGGHGEHADVLAVLLVTTERVFGRPVTGLDALAEIARDPSRTRRSRSRALIELACAARDAGDLARAEARFREAVDVAAPAGGAAPANARVSYGAFLSGQGRPAEALPWLLRARDEVPGPSNRATMSVAVGAALRALGQWEEAEQTFLEAEEVLEAAGSYLAEAATLGRAVLRWSRGSWSDGDRLCDEAVPQVADDVPGVIAFRHLARLVRVAALPDGAEFEAALDAARRTGLPPTTRDDAAPCLPLARERAAAAGFGDRAARIDALAEELDRRVPADCARVAGPP